MDVNKGIAAVLVVGIVFFLTGLIGDNLVRETEPSKPALDIKVSAVPAAEASKPRAAATHLTAAGERRSGRWRGIYEEGLHRLPHLQRRWKAAGRPEPLWSGRRGRTTTRRASTTRRPWKSLSAPDLRGIERVAVQTQPLRRARG